MMWKAFLNSPIANDTYVYVRVDAELSQLFVERYNDLKKSLNDNGTLTFRFRRYLYGLQESPLAWNKLLHQKLEAMQFQRSTADPCAYVKCHKDGPLYLTVHVDDMLLISSTKRTRQMFESIMEEHFEITKQLNSLSYLRITIEKNDLGIRVHQMGCMDSLITKFSADPNSQLKCPTGTEFLSHDKEDAKVNKTKYLGLIMSLMFLALRELTS